MNQQNIIKFVIVLTVLSAITLYLLQDHSGIAVTDVQSNEDNTLTAYLRVGKHFDQLNCVYNFQDENNQNMESTSNIRNNISMGSFPINETFNSSINPSKVQIMVYDTTWNNQTPIYNTTFQLK